MHFWTRHLYTLYPSWLLASACPQSGNINLSTEAESFQLHMHLQVPELQMKTKEPARPDLPLRIPAPKPHTHQARIMWQANSMSYGAAGMPRYERHPKHETLNPVILIPKRRNLTLPNPSYLCFCCFPAGPWTNY